MTTELNIVNRALQFIGTRTNVSQAELTNQSSNEAIQASLILDQVRDELLRMAPWDCAFNYASLTLITAAPGTPENPTTGPAFWQKGVNVPPVAGIPPPPWAYEYQYPADCLKAVFVVPQFSTGFASGVPITTAVTGGSPAFWSGPPQRFRVGVDQFVSLVAPVTVVNGGTGYATGEIILLAGTPTGTSPIGAPATVQVFSQAGGVATGVSLLEGGSYFNDPGTSLTQGSSLNGTGTGLIINASKNFDSNQRVILTNQEGAILAYVKQITDPNVMDPEFQEAWVQLLGARLAIVLTGDKALANAGIQEANRKITEARRSDANEGLTVNDVTPDWIRARGLLYPSWEMSPNVSYDWGPMLTMY